MLDRVPVDIVDVIGPIVIIPDAMLPEARLPRASPTPPAEPRLDHLPARRVIRIAIRQRPERMNMIRQDNDGIHRKRPLVPHLPEYVAQMIDLNLVIEDWSSFLRHYCEEIRRSGCLIASISHAGDHSVRLSGAAALYPTYEELVGRRGLGSS